MRPIQSLLGQFAHQPELVKRFLAFDQLGEAAYLRTHIPGHFTASCWLVDCTGKRVLLTHHRKLNRWLQLGGHADGDTDLVRVALSEAREESGLSDLLITPQIFDLDVHEIPARASDPAHLHWDVRFVVRAMGSLDFVTSAESIALAWRNISEVANDAAGLYDDSVRRMALRWIDLPTRLASQ